MQLKTSWLFLLFYTMPDHRIRICCCAAAAAAAAYVACWLGPLVACWLYDSLVLFHNISIIISKKGE
jgi:hypothetical protein